MILHEIPGNLAGFGLREINLYPYLTWVFYGALLFFSPFWMRTEKRLFTLFLITLVFETAFLIDLGFFVRPSYVMGLILVVRTFAHGVTFPGRYFVLLILLAFSGIVGIFLNLDLIGAATSGESRATFLRPLIQLGQLTAMILIAISVFTILKQRGYFKHAVRVLHWLAVAVAVYAVYEVVAIYLHLPYLNLDSQLSEYWYLNFGAAEKPFFRPRVTFIEPIELNNFQMLGIASSLVYRILYNVPWRRYWPFLFLQLTVLIGTFSRSTLLTLFVVIPVSILFYPRKVRTAMGFLFSRFGPLLLALPVFFVLYFTFTLNVIKVKEMGPVGQIFFERFAYIKDEQLGITILGRPTAVKEVMKLVDDGRLSFGLGIGNEANWLGGVWGTSSIYSQVLFYSGIFGVSFFSLFIGSILYELFWNYRRKAADILYRRVNWIFFIGFLGMMVQRLAFSGLLTDTYLWVAFALCIYLGQLNKSDDLVLVEKKDV